MKRARPDLQGIDFERTLRAAAKEMLATEEDLRKREIDAQAHEYKTVHEIDVMVFEERRNPAMWRIETLKPGPNSMGIVTARDPNPQYLEAELRHVLKGKFEVYGVAQNSAEARTMACDAVLRVVGRVPLRDADRFEGERGGR